MSRLLRGAVLALAILLLGTAAAYGAGWYRTHDFYAIYSGSRLVAIGADPYDEVVWCAETEHATPKDFDATRDIAVCFVRYAYPLWTALLFLPLGLLPLPYAAALWMAASIALFIAGLRWCWLAVRGDAGWAGPFAAIVVFSQPFTLLLVLGQMGAVLFAVTAFTTYRLSRQEDRAAGVGLAFAALKPNVLLVYALALLAWSAVARRFWFAIAALASGGILLVASVLVRPSWPAEWLGELFGRQIGHAVEYGTVWGLAAVDLHAIWSAPVLIVALVLVVWWLARDHLRDPVALSAVAVPVSLFATPYAWSYDHLVLALPWALVLSVAAHSHPARRRALLLALLLIATVAPWALWIAATLRHTESLTALVPAATAVLAAYALRLSGSPGERGHERAPRAAHPT